MTPEFIISGWALTVVFSGFDTYVDVKIAIAQMQGRLDGHEEKLKDHGSRIERLESPYFAEEQR